MRTSSEFIELVRAAGAEVSSIYGGTSYRAGGWLVVHPIGYFNSPTPVSVEKTTEYCFDPTGYDGRGRKWDVWRLVTNADGMVPVSHGQFSKLSPENRSEIGSESKSGGAPMLFGRPGTDNHTDVMSVLGGVLEQVKVGPIVVTRHPALVSLLIERGTVRSGVRVIDHATEKDVTGQHVIGVLPLSLAALAQKVTEIPLALTPEMRGKELDLETLRKIAGKAVTYTVTINEN